jgi:hypothetical protein
MLARRLMLIAAIPELAINCSRLARADVDPLPLHGRPDPRAASRRRSSGRRVVAAAGPGARAADAR